MGSACRCTIFHPPSSGLKIIVTRRANGVIPLFQAMANRRHVGEDQPSHPRTLTGSLEKGSSAQRWRSRFPVGKDHRGRRGSQRLRRGQEGQGTQAASVGRHRRLGAQGQGPQRQGYGLRGDQDATAESGRGFPRLSHLWLDAGYRGEDKGADWVRKTLGWSVDLLERPRKPASEEVLRAWAREWAKEGLALDWEKFMPPKGFLVVPRRWVVERTLSWIEKNRRMSLGTTRGYVRAAKRSCTLP
jgi:transposase